MTPGFLRSEWMLDHFGVTEANWRDAAKKVKEFIADPNVARNGRVFASWDLARKHVRFPASRECS